MSLLGDIVRGAVMVALGDARQAYARTWDRAKRAGYIRGYCHLAHGCTLCGQPWFSTYMVEDDTWVEAGFTRNVLACVVCLQRSLDRPLALDDFTSAECNRLVHVGARIQVRVGRIVPLAEIRSRS